MTGLDVVVNSVDTVLGWGVIFIVVGVTVYAVIRGIRIEIKHSFKGDEDDE